MPNAPKLDAPQGWPLFEVQFRAISEALAGNGVLTTTDLEVTATANALEIQTAAGTAYYQANEVSLNNAPQTFTLTGGDADHDRWDTVYFDTSTGDAGVREGTPEQYPSPPDVQGDEILLAIVYIESGATDVAGTDILNWRAKFSNEAEEVHYDDGTGTYNTSNVAGALDILQQAAQIESYPLSQNDLDTDSVGADEIISGAVGTDELASSAVTSSEIATGAVTSDGIADGTVADADVDPNTTIARSKLDDQRSTTVVTSSTYTTTDEEHVLVDTASITAASTITLASADASEGNTIAIIDVSGSAETYPITIDAGGGETIDGSASMTINANHAGAILTSDGNNWSTVSNAFIGMTIQDSGAQVAAGVQTIDAGSLITATDNGDRVTFDAEVSGKSTLATGTFTHTGGSATSHTVTGVTTDQTANLHVEVGVDTDPSFSADYAWSYTWGEAWVDADGQVNVTIDAAWDTDPGSGNDVTLDYEVYQIDDVATQGVGVDDSGAETVPAARRINFGNNINVTDPGDGTADVDVPDSITPVGKLTTSDGSTNINQQIMFPWDASPMTDSPFSWDSANPRYLTVDEAGTYEVHVNISIDTDGGARDSPNALLYKNRTSSGSGNGTRLADGRTGYVRDNDGHNQSSLHISWIGELAAGDTLAIEMFEDASSGSRSCQPNGTNMYVKKVNRP